ncbi:hypothetical protein BOTBODRAFT_181901 [Botryobasidium botryosum FD-172 SS1]|uniref:Uncharacterized protein n=1 Tax=Botryobasidium botryosum (strain FD-172 SS1) TaxID=930990 RepID=A0A067LST3_BOTB1|nr:hypothetical protein BOTBODRAFT_181901 [Botryobasidium botryosum FD-172 SS1]
MNAEKSKHNTSDMSTQDDMDSFFDESAAERNSITRLNAITMVGTRTRSDTKGKGKAKEMTPEDEPEKKARQTSCMPGAPLIDFNKPDSTPAPTPAPTPFVYNARATSQLREDGYLFQAMNGNPAMNNNADAGPSNRAGGFRNRRSRSFTRFREPNDDPSDDSEDSSSDEVSSISSNDSFRT